MRRFLGACGFVFLLASNLLGQNYRCDWSVVGQGGGEMSSSYYRTGSTVGQTAIGVVVSPNYRAYLGFWQGDTAPSGIEEEETWCQHQDLATSLLALAPNPCIGDVVVHYSLASEAHIVLRLFDRSGRCVRELVRGLKQPGRYSMLLPVLPRGVYFLNLRTNDYQATRKIVIN